MALQNGKWPQELTEYDCLPAHPPPTPTGDMKTLGLETPGQSMYGRGKRGTGLHVFLSGALQRARLVLQLTAKFGLKILPDVFQTSSSVQLCKTRKTPAFYLLTCPPSLGTV